MGTGVVIFEWEDPKSGARLLAFRDAVQRDSETNVLVTTDYPVEEGFRITDHLRAEPKSLAFDVFVSADPSHAGVILEDVTFPVTVPDSPSAQPLEKLVDGAAAAFGRAVGFPRNGPVTSFTSKRPPRGRDFLREVLEALEELQGRLEGTKPALIKVTSTLRPMIGLYALTNWTPERGAPEGDGMRLSLELRQVRKAKVRLVPAPRPTVIRATKKAPVGSQQTKPPDAKVDRSALKQLFVTGSKIAGGG